MNGNTVGRSGLSGKTKKSDQNYHFLLVRIQAFGFLFL